MIQIMKATTAQISILSIAKMNNDRREIGQTIQKLQNIYLVCKMYSNAADAFG